MAIYTTYSLFICCKGNAENKLSLSQLTFCSYAALIRGAIAFGLIQNVNNKQFGRWVHSNGKANLIEETEVIKSSILYLVILTTVIIGGLTPPV